MLHINNIAFHYENKDWLFKGLDLELAPGKICGVLGKNGVGKTSLLRIMAGLLFPQEGSCNILNSAPGKRLPSFLQEIYFLPEEFYLPNITVKKYLDLYAPFYPRFNQKLFFANLKELELTIDQNLNNLSYGQKKKFLLAFALATDCKLLLLDEPSNGLDIPSKSQFRKLIASALTEEKTFIISTHQVRDLESLIDTIVLLENGKIVFHQPLLAIGKHLVFAEESETKKSCLYQEKTFSGNQVIKINRSKIESQINLELLFNAVIANAEKINAPFLLGSKK